MLGPKTYFILFGHNTSYLFGKKSFILLGIPQHGILLYAYPFPKLSKVV
jgi:hypothetical protein